MRRTADELCPRAQLTGRSPGPTHVRADVRLATRTADEHPAGVLIAATESDPAGLITEVQREAARQSLSLVEVPPLRKEATTSVCRVSVTSFETAQGLVGVQ
jgi:hypothetical protein